MRLKRTRTMTLVVALAFAGLYAVFAVLAAAPVQAIGPMGSGIEILMFDDDHVGTPTGQIGGSGILAQGTMDGSLTCKHDDQSCQGVIDVALAFQPSSSGHLLIEYRFRSLADFSADRPRRMVVLGDGEINNGGALEPFTFSLTVEDPGNGRLSLTYQATNPKATFQLDAPDTWVSSQ